MQYLVYHREDNAFHTDPRTFTPDMKGFRLVALVECDDRSKAFSLTNSIAWDHWRTNPEVKWSAPGDLRSTSVGDIIVELVETEYHVVLPYGFDCVTFRGV